MGGSVCVHLPLAVLFHSSVPLVLWPNEGMVNLQCDTQHTCVDTVVLVSSTHSWFGLVTELRDPPSSEASQARELFRDYTTTVTTTPFTHYSKTTVTSLVL